MGLDFHVEGWDHECPHWSYTGFNRFREHVAETAGIDLMRMRGYAGYYSRGGCLAARGKPWPGKDPIEHLLNHSDCGGELSAAVCAEVHERLRELIRNWPEPDDAWSAFDKQEGLLLADAMEAAAKLKVPLEFW